METRLPWTALDALLFGARQVVKAIEIVISTVKGSVPVPQHLANALLAILRETLHCPSGKRGSVVARKIALTHSDERADQRSRSKLGFPTMREALMQSGGYNVFLRIRTVRCLRPSETLRIDLDVGMDRELDKPFCDGCGNLLIGIGRNLGQRFLLP